MKRFFATSILAIFATLPLVQLQCEIVCADDDHHEAAVVQAQAAMIGAPLAITAPDDCAAHATQPPALASSAFAHHPAFAALAGIGQPDVLAVQRIAAFATAAVSRPPGSPPPESGRSLRI